MYQYTRSIHYYETDKMGITHHANYIHLMEEARIAFLDDIGWSYKKIESLGIGSPVTGIRCKYQSATTFADRVTVELRVKSYNGVVYIVDYTMRSAEGKTVLTGESEHCFVDSQGKLILLRKVCPELEQVLMGLVEG